MKPLFLAAALLNATAALAQAPAPAVPIAAQPVDAARLPAARRVVDVVFPLAQREQMIAAMVAAASNMMQGTVMQQADVVRLMKTEPRARPLIERFLKEQEAKNVVRMQANIPGMVEAMTNAYARRFTMAQLDDLHAFFETVTGKAYVVQSMTIMSDPDVAAWQRKVMTANLEGIGPDVRQFLQELMALVPAKKAKQ
jgi:hypothetical protein